MKVNDLLQIFIIAVHLRRNMYLYQNKIKLNQITALSE